MIKGNIIKFGYGDVAVHGDYMGFIEFTNIKPPLECGQTITDKVKKDLEIGLKIRIYGYDLQLYELMKDVSETNKIIEYKGYKLDFSNYNANSVGVVEEAALNMANPMCLAC